MREAGYKVGQTFVLDAEKRDDVYRRMFALDRYRDENDYPKDLAGLIEAMDASGTDLDDWFREHFGRDIEHPAWIFGFVYGALAKFHELAP